MATEVIGEMGFFKTSTFIGPNALSVWLVIYLLVSLLNALLAKWPMSFGFLLASCLLMLLSKEVHEWKYATLSQWLSFFLRK